MGTITINVDDDVEKEFRNAVAEKEGIGKGKLGGAVTEAINLWIDNKRQEQIAQRQIALMKKGFVLGKFKFDRDELHERKH
ncbi:MAG TPA: hypothetical protein VI894_00925 [Candidatus Nanoarchaeia archaeon]|nr:hypothetical protein [Candidatus Nanoarchaeia archaeon]